MNVLINMWQFWAFLVVAFLVLRSVLNPDPRKMLNDHVMYIHATLGMGKTALAAHWVQRVLNPYGLADRIISKLIRRSLKDPPIVYSTFDLKGCKPLDLSVGGWPVERGSKIVIDELLLLESNDLVPVEWFSRGCTLARQLGQQVVIISQASRLPRKLDKFKGTIGLWITMKGVSFGKIGRLIIVKRASEPFIRRTKGFKADGQKTSLVFIPGRVFTTYNSRKIYGYTVNAAGEWIDYATEQNASGVDNQGAAHEPEARSADGAAHAPQQATPRKKRVHRVKRDNVQA